METKLNKFQLEMPRYDLYTGDILPYKSKEFYFNSLYSTRTNLINHFKTLSHDEIIEITKNILKSRKVLKNLVYAPSTVELKSIIAPSILLLEHYGIDYNKICKEIGLITKYEYNKVNIKNVKLINKIIVDTREQTPLDLPKFVHIEKLCLKVGDYCSSQDITDKLVIERKSLSDLLGTISKGLERFCKELIRGEEKNTNILIVVESKFAQAISFNFLPHIKSRATPEFIFNRIRELIQNYPNIQFVFCDGRKQASNITHLALSHGKSLMDYDLQYLLEKKIIF